MIRRHTAWTPTKLSVFFKLSAEIKATSREVCKSNVQDTDQSNNTVCGIDSALTAIRPVFSFTYVDFARQDQDAGAALGCSQIPRVDALELVGSVLADNANETRPDDDILDHAIMLRASEGNGCGRTVQREGAKRRHVCWRKLAEPAVMNMRATCAVQVNTATAKTVDHHCGADVDILPVENAERHADIGCTAVKCQTRESKIVDAFGFDCATANGKQRGALRETGKCGEDTTSNVEIRVALVG